MIGVAKLKQQLKQQDIRGLYLFCGEESYLIDTYVKRLCHLLVDPSLRDFNYSFYNEDNESYEAFSNDLEAYPTMAERKLIVLKNTRLMKLAEYQKPLAAQLSGLPPYVVLVIVEEDVSKIKKALLQTIEANGQLVEFKKQSPADLRAWVGRTFAEAGKNIRSEDAAYLVELCGRSLGTLHTECDKLIAAAEGQAVSRRLIDDMVQMPLEYKIYDLADKLLAHDADGAYRLLREFKNTKVQPIVVLGLIYGQLANLYMYHALSAEGKNAAEFLPANRRFLARRLEQAYRRHKRETLREGMCLCAQYDLAVKAGGMDGYTALELVMAALLNEKK